MSLGRRRRIFSVFDCSALDLILREAFFDGGGKPSDDIFHRQSVPLKVGEICVQMYIRASPLIIVQDKDEAYLSQHPFGPFRQARSCDYSLQYQWSYTRGTNQCQPETWSGKVDCEIPTLSGT